MIILLHVSREYGKIVYRDYIGVYIVTISPRNEAVSGRVVTESA